MNIFVFSTHYDISLASYQPLKSWAEWNYEGNEGYSLIFHQDFLQGYPLARKIKQYGFFAYVANVALHLSGKERTTTLSLYDLMRKELNSLVDGFSHEVIIAQLEPLLSYANRFYKRQFLIRQVVTNNLLEQLEELLNTYFNEEKPLSQGIPTVQYLADKLNHTPNTPAIKWKTNSLSATVNYTYTSMELKDITNELPEAQLTPLTSIKARLILR